MTLRERIQAKLDEHKLGHVDVYAETPPTDPDERLEYQHAVEWAARVDGAVVEFCLPGEWRELKRPKWNWFHDTYRIQPPKREPLDGWWAVWRGDRLYKSREECEKSFANELAAGTCEIMHLREVVNEGQPN